MNSIKKIIPLTHLGILPLNKQVKKIENIEFKDKTFIFLFINNDNVKSYSVNKSIFK